MLTLKAFDLFGLKPVKLMCLLYVLLIEILDLVMTEPAVKELFALLTLLHASSPVVLASFFHHLALFLLLQLLS